MSRGGGPVAVARAAAAATASAGEERGGGAPAAPAAAPCCDGDTSSGAPSPTPGSAPPPGHAAARTGRHRQRFDASGARLVAGAIPVRTRAGPGGGAVVEVLMIRSTRGEGLIFPKACGGREGEGGGSGGRAGGGGRGWAAPSLSFPLPLPAPPPRPAAPAVLCTDATVWRPPSACARRAQGGWETDESVEEAAGRESWEEAGVRGVLQARARAHRRRRY